MPSFIKQQHEIQWALPEKIDNQYAIETRFLYTSARLFPPALQAFRPYLDVCPAKTRRQAVVKEKIPSASTMGYCRDRPRHSNPAPTKKIVHQ